ncbi:MAG: DUF2332 family protein, partial [Caulobacteraceae bacterium]
IRALKLQAGGCAALGSPFCAGLLERFADDVTAGGASLALFAPWAEASTRTLMTEAVPIRLLGALHDLVLSGDAPDLAAAYPQPGHPANVDRAWSAAREVVETDAARLVAFMGHEPQTNEVRRSACLLGGFLTVAAETGLPLRCFELGASAGLNQLWDQFRYDFGEAGGWGDPAAAVAIDAEWRGRPGPLATPARVIEHAACDRAPVDLADPIARRRLRAFVWADQFDRLARLDGAIAAALAAGTQVETADAVDWATRRAHPAPGAATVLYHSVFQQYMPPESQAALAALARARGQAATAEAPFAWLRMEPPPDNLAVMELRLTLWPGGDDRRLATVHPHGAWVEWEGARAGTC